MIIFHTKTTPHFNVLLQVLYHQFNTKTHTFLRKWGVRKLQMPHLHWQLFKCIRLRLRHHWWTCQPITESTHYNCAASAERIPRAGPSCAAAAPVNRRAFLPEPLTQISTELRRYPLYLRNVLFAYRILQKPLFN